ncbi:MAG: hypothetical protein ACKPFA_39440, partial [Dolichospermum sp.]
VKQYFETPNIKDVDPLKGVNKNVQFGVGPVIENGCYYDFILPRTLIPEDLPLIEDKIKELLKRNLVFKVQEMELSEAITLFENAGQPLKVELLNDLATRGTTSMSEEEKADFGEEEIIPFDLKSDIQSSYKYLLELTNSIESRGISNFFVYYESLIILLNKINLNKDIIRRNIKIAEPVDNFTYKRKQGEKFISDGKVGNIFDLIKFLKTVVSHPEADHLIAVDEYNNRLSCNILGQ